MEKDEIVKKFKALLRKKHEYLGDHWTWAEQYEDFSEVCGFKVEKPEGTAKRNARNPIRQKFAKACRAVIPYNDYCFALGLKHAEQLVDAIIAFHSEGMIPQQQIQHGDSAIGRPTEGVPYDRQVTAPPEIPLAVAARFLEQGKSGKWAWETCVEDVAESLGFDYSGDNVEAVMVAARSLGECYPGGRKKGSDIWNDMDLMKESQFVVDFVQQAFSSFEPTPNYSQVSLERLWSSVDESPSAYSGHARELLECEFRKYPIQQIPTSAGLYALWRSVNYGSLVYIGEGQSIEARIKTYVPGGSWAWWGRSTIWMTYSLTPALAQAERRSAEKAAIAILNPRAN